MFGPLIELFDCQALYNVLNEGADYARLSDPYYLYLIDCRPRNDYNESHIICAKLMKKDGENYRLLYESELQCRNLIVVYDSNTSSLDESSPAIECAKLLAQNGSKFSVKVLNGGFEAFSKFYPFLRTQQIIYMPRELDEIKTYPSEILPGLLYLGNRGQSLRQNVKKDLKLKSYVDCTNTDELFKFKNEKSIEYLNIPIEDEPEQSIKSFLKQACDFIDFNVKNRKQPCLVFSDLGLSRAAAIVIAYLIYSEKLTIEEAVDKVSRCKKIQPQVKFLREIDEFFSSPLTEQ